MVPRIETVFQDAELTLRWLPGRTRRMVVVFTGLKHRFGGQPLDEFARSAAGRAGNGVLFVTDRRGTWFSAPYLWRRIVGMVTETRDSEGMTEVISIGNSMGGFGALLLARDMRVARAIAFAPQVSMDRGLLDDARWPDVAARWGHLPARSAAEAVGVSRTGFYLIAGAECAEDVAHLNLMPETRRVTRWLVPGAGHSIARRLKEAGRLHRVVSALVRGRRAEADGLLAGFGQVAA
ncbi:MAG: hypothetical protein AAF919_14435 [Pseudomonadota bacterium]